MDKICHVENCEHLTLRNSILCPTHWSRWYRHGDVQADKPIRSYVRRGVPNVRLNVVPSQKEPIT